MTSTLWLDLLRLVAIGALILANGFFVAAEFALVRVRRTRIDELVTQGRPAARWVQRAIADPDRFIAATQLGITLASLALGWLGEPALAHLLEPLVTLFPISWQPGVSHSLSAALSFAVITFLLVVVGELAPKSVALQNPERTSLIVARPTLWMARLFRPFIWLLNASGSLVVRWMGIRPASERELAHSVEELKMLVSASAESGLVADEEEEMVHAVLDFGDTLVRQVMVPRTEMVAVPAETDLPSLIETAIRHPFTKLPVYEGDLDHILGVVHLQDVLPASRRAPQPARTARELMREVLFVPDTARVSAVLRLFRSRRQHMAVVLDEFGGTAGVVTLEDLLEEIVGEVRDPFDQEPDIQPLQDGTALIDGLTPIEEVNDHFGLSLRDPHYDTIAGYILGRLGRLARVGDMVAIENVRLRVEAMDGLRIAQLSLTPLPRGHEPPGSPRPG